MNDEGTLANGSNSGAPYRNLTRDVLLATAAGIACGVLINVTDWSFGREMLALEIFDAIGQLFLRALQLLIIPVVLISLVCGIASLGSASALGRIGIKAIALFLVTTGLAIGLAVGVSMIIQPGTGFLPPEALDYSPPAVQPVKEVLVGLVPQNPVAAMAEGNMLQVVVFATLFGIAVVSAGDHGKRIRALFDDLNVVVMRLVTIVSRFAPIGVFALLAKLAATLDWRGFSEMLSYLLTVLFVLGLQGLILYPVLVALLTKQSPFPFLSKMRAVAAFAFGTASSSATIPITLRTVVEKLGVSRPVASFTIPVGATINMDGAAIMQGVATVFIANAYGIELSLAQLAGLVVMAMLASIAAAGVPGVALVLLATVLTYVGLPVEGIALVLGVDRLVDMVRTAVNVTGDAVVACVVAHSEGQLDAARFADPAA